MHPLLKDSGWNCQFLFLEMLWSQGVMAERVIKLCFQGLLFLILQGPRKTSEMCSFHHTALQVLYQQDILLFVKCTYLLLLILMFKISKDNSGNYLRMK